MTKELTMIRATLMSLLILVIGLGSAHGDEPATDLSLMRAVRRQDQPAIAKLLDRKAHVNARQADGATALHWAVHRDDIETTKRLIKLGAKVDVKNDFGVTPLSLACTNGNARIVETLIKAGADLNSALLTGETPLMTASRTGSLDAVEVLLKNGAKANAKEPVREQTALMWAVAEKHARVVRKLIEHGADVKAATKLGFTPLLFAARAGDLESTKMLLRAGVDVNTKSKDRLSALHVATIRGHVKTAVYLLEKGADPNDQGPGYTALHWAVGTWETELNGANGIRAAKGHEWDRMRGVREDKLALVTALLKKGADPNARLRRTPPRFGFTITKSPGGSTPLTLAAFAGEGEIMRLLVKHGADMSLKPSGGLTPLLIAAGVKRFRPENAVSEDKLLLAVKAAVELGASVNQRGPGGNTALHGAAWIRSKKIIRFLVENGADIDARNKKQQTPIYIALRDGRGMGDGPKLDTSPVADLLRELKTASIVGQKSSQKKPVDPSSDVVGNPLPSTDREK